MKTTIILLIAVAFIFYSGDGKITFSPFTFELPAWRNVLGLVFLILSLSFFQMHHKKEARKEALEDFIKIVKEVNNDTST